MKKVKGKVVNSYFALIYHLVCVPILALLSMWIYKSLVINVRHVNVVLQFAVISVLIVANIALIYFIAKILVKKINMPLFYHVVTGAIALVALIWINVYFQTLEANTCSDFSAIDCADAISKGKTALICLLAFVHYYVVYIFIHKIVESEKGIKAVS